MNNRKYFTTCQLILFRCNQMILAKNWRSECSWALLRQEAQIYAGSTKLTIGGVKFDDSKCVKTGFNQFLLDLFMKKGVRNRN